MPATASSTERRRSERVPVVSAAMKRSVASEAHLVQQARRSNKGTNKNRSATINLSAPRKQTSGTTSQENAVAQDIVFTAGTKANKSNATQSRAVLVDITNASTSTSRKTPRVPAGTRSGMAISDFDTAATNATTTSRNALAAALFAPLSRNPTPGPSTSTPNNEPAHRRGTARLFERDEEGEDEEPVFSTTGDDADPEEDAEDVADEVPPSAGAALEWTDDEDERLSQSEDGNDGDGEEEGHSGARLGKRKCSSSRDTTHKKARRPKAGDFNAESEAILNTQLGCVRARMLMQCPMPDIDESIDVAIQGWEDALEARPNLSPEDDVPFIVLGRRAGPQLRGRIRDAARSRVVSHYNLDTRPRAQGANQRRVAELLSDQSYIYEDVETHEGPYYNALPFKIIQASHFGKPSDDGILYRRFFEPGFSIQAIAFLYTTIHACLDEWRNGTFTRITFSMEVYRPIYESHLANLTALNNADPLFVKGVGEELFEDCVAALPSAGPAAPAQGLSAPGVAHGTYWGSQRRARRLAEQQRAAGISDA